MLGALSVPATREALDSLGMKVPGVEALSRGLQPRPAVPAAWTAVTDAVNPGLVDIETRLANGIGAGTGMVLTADGRVLTNYHVVEGARRIVVTSVTTGDEYDAHLVGANPDEDVAVIQLEGAAGLATIPIGDPGSLRIDDPVAAIGNAGGLGGPPSVAAGTIVGLDQSITATDEDGSSAERLSGMIGVQADVQPGDSGGALAAADGRVVGMTTAASSASRTRRAQTRSGGGYGFAIPIDHAIEVADEIVADG
jgi:S1-C subfamily serine protease